VKKETSAQVDFGENQVVVYQPDETVRLDVRLEEDTVWLTQGQMTELFQRDRTVITRHINNVFAEGELDEKSNVHFLHIPFSDKPIKVYSLNVIISVGYRVKSPRGTQFRIWATVSNVKMLPVANSNFQCGMWHDEIRDYRHWNWQHWDWQHFHIGNIPAFR
jgi:hypothetical protein